MQCEIVLSEDLYRSELLGAGSELGVCSLGRMPIRKMGLLAKYSGNGQWIDASNGTGRV